MKIDDKIQLVKLLGEYMSETAAGNMKRTERDRYNLNNAKSLFTHARILHTKLSVEIEKNLKTIWD